jgi:SPX domain protein involved in polyphosphate accumulation
MRYEKKFILEKYDLAQLRAWIMLHTAAFRVAFPKRLVQNIYFDTPDFQALEENLAGVSDRKKYRVRWYNDETQAAILECKIKKGLLGEKKTWKLDNLPSNLLENLSVLTKNVEAITTLKLQPTSINHYEREYYESFDRRFRLTIDYNIQYQQPDYKNAFPVHIETPVVLELKYDATHEEEAEKLFRSFPLRQSRHSKYVNGVL